MHHIITCSLSYYYTIHNTHTHIHMYIYIHTYYIDVYSYVYIYIHMRTFIYLFIYQFIYLFLYLSYLHIYHTISIQERILVIVKPASLLDSPVEQFCMIGSSPVIMWTKWIDNHSCSQYIYIYPSFGGFMYNHCRDYCIMVLLYIFLFYWLYVYDYPEDIYIYMYTYVTI